MGISRCSAPLDGSHGIVKDPDRNRAWSRRCEMIRSLETFRQIRCSRVPSIRSGHLVRAEMLAGIAMVLVALEIFLFFLIAWGRQQRSGRSRSGSIRIGYCASPHARWIGKISCDGCLSLVAQFGNCGCRRRPVSVVQTKVIECVDVKFISSRVGRCDRPQLIKDGETITTAVGRRQPRRRKDGRTKSVGESARWQREGARPQSTVALRDC